MRSSVGRQSVFIGRRRCDARTPAEESAETGAKFVVHPAVDEWIVTAVTHGQPVTQCPHGLNVSVVTQTHKHTACLVTLYQGGTLDGKCARGGPKVT